MRSVNTAFLFAVAAAAQSTVTLLDPFDDISTINLVGSASSITTYQVICPASSSSASSSSQVTLAPRPTITDFFPTTPPITTTSLPARIRRQDDGDNGDECVPYSIIQGASTWEFHQTVPGQVTIDASCSWTGASTTADMTCVAAESGSAITESDSGTTTTIWSASDRSTDSAYVTVAVVTASSSGSTSSGSASAKTTGSSSKGSTSSTSATASHSTGMAAPMPFPTGAMAWVGGAAGLLAAAVAL